MIDVSEMVKAVRRLAQGPDHPIAMALTILSPHVAHEVILAIVEEASRAGIAIQRIVVDPAIASELGLHEGVAISENAHTVLKVEPGLNRQVIFEHLPAAKLN